MKSLMSKKNADMVDDSENNQELLDLKQLEAMRLFWAGKGEVNIASWDSKRMLSFLDTIMVDENRDNTEKFQFPAMEEYKKHSFPKSTRLNVVPMSKLIYIERKTGKSFNELVLDMINTEYERAKRKV